MLRHIPVAGGGMVIDYGIRDSCFRSAGFSTPWLLLAASSVEHVGRFWCVLPFAYACLTELLHFGVLYTWIYFRRCRTINLRDNVANSLRHVALHS